MMRHSATIFFLLLSFIWIGPTPALPEAPVEDPSPSAAVDFRSELDAAIQAKHFAGLAAGVARGGEVLWIGAGGSCDVEAGRKCSSSTPMRIASITKPMTAVAILQLHEEELLDLDIPIATYLPDYPAAVASKITTRELLHHTAGLGAYKSSKETETVKEYKTLADAARVFQGRDLLFEPGTSYSYSTYGYVVLGMVIESASGKSYEDYLRERIWLPASMKSTGIERFGRRGADHSQLYTKSRRGRIKEAKANNLSNRIPGGGVYSTVEDLLRFGDALLDGTLLSPASLAALQTYPDVDRAENNPYGMGFFIYSEDPDHGPILGHSGEQTGAAGQLMILPKEGLVVVVLSNTSHAWQQAIELSVVMIRRALAAKAAEK